MISFLDNKLKLSATFLVVGFILLGCGATGGSSAGSDASSEVNTIAVAVDKPIYTAELGLKPRQRFSKALEKLENGEDGQALAELNAYLIAVPGSKKARNLIAQISTDPAEYFPSENFIVHLTSGISLSTLAKTYLGSALEFYALAKYNNISNPSRVNIGQDIKIPLTQLARTQRDIENNLELEAEEEKKESAVDVAKTNKISDIDNNITESAVAEVILMAPEVTAESALSDLQALTLNKDYAAAIEKIAVLQTFGPFNNGSRALAKTTFTERAKEIADTDNILAATYYAQAGRLSLLDEDTFAAFESFKMATDLDEQNDQVMEEMLVLQKEIADKYHREGASAFRRQELDLAIEKWDMVLKFNPEHSSAKLYRAQALELKERLHNINQN